MEGALDLPGSSIFRGRPFVEWRLLPIPLLWLMGREKKKGGHDIGGGVREVYVRLQRSRGKGGCPARLREE